MAQQGKVKFRRIRGRIVPVREKRAARELAGAVTGKDLGILGGAAAATLGGLFSAGKIEKQSQKLSKVGKFKASNVLNRLAKFTKFGSKFAPAIVAGGVVAGIDRRTTKDERSKFFNVGNRTGATNIAIAGVTAFGVARLGKRFEKFGLRGGKFPFKLRDI